jgi:spore photoproduct lyase
MKPRRLIIEAGLQDTRLGRVLAEKLPVAEVRTRIGPQDYPSFGAGDLILARHQGHFLKPCPGTRGYRCCGLQIIHFGLGCFLDCTYCILQSYLDTKAMVVFGNLEEELLPLHGALTDPGSPFKRFCTGEFTDSLILEDLTGLGAALVKLFARTTDRILELKTKTVNIRSLLDLDHGGRTIISFSLNAPEVSQHEEAKAAGLTRRLQAAKEAVSAGYRVGFHFDPLIRHQNWAQGYRQTVEQLFQAVPASQIAWISLGAFRYLPGLKDTVRKQHPHSRIMDQEFILAADGKMRYLRPLRVEMYSRLLEYIRAASDQVCVYMCMESSRVWQEVFGFDPGPEGLAAMLDARV